ncbi:MAG: hypothetical protein H6766_03430 [Candidatus Peribacteria bacterium]|nr:MAG: hypothetical protein H6766_03430 [Candidatus Peribacteria bacterium]
MRQNGNPLLRPSVHHDHHRPRRQIRSHAPVSLREDMGAGQKLLKEFYQTTF